MKKYIVSLFLVLILMSNLNGELDFQHVDTFSKSYTSSLAGKNVVKNSDKILLITSYGVEIYETTETDLIEIATYNLPMVFWADLYGDTMALIFDNIDGDPYYRDIVNIYDISNIEEPQLINQIETNLHKVYLKENVAVLGHHNQVSIISLENSELLYSYPDTFLCTNIEDSEGFTIRDSLEDNYYLCHLNEEKQIIRDKNLGPSAGRVYITNDKLLYCYGEFIDFYTVADSLEFIRTFHLNYITYLGRHGLCVFDSTLVLIAFDRTPLHLSYLLYLDISDIQNIVELNRDEFLPELGCNKRFEVYDSAQWNDNYLFAIKDYGVIYSNYNNNLDDYNLLKYQRIPRLGNIYNNYLYLNYQNATYFNTAYDITDINNITQIETEDSLGAYYWFGEEENQFVVKQNLIDETLELYSFSDNVFTYIDSYEISGYIKDYQHFIKIILWNGEDLIYNFFKNIYWVRYENGGFRDLYIDEVYQPNSTVSWHYYNNYLYKISEHGQIKIYSKEDDGIELLNTINISLASGDLLWGCGINDGLLYLGDGPTKIYDLDIDPVNLTAEFDLNVGTLNSKIVRYGDYYLYTGCDRDSSLNSYFFESLSSLCIYKKVGYEFVRVGDIYNNRQTWDLEIVGQDEDNFTLFLLSVRGVDVYTCQATPNGQLEITPVTLQAFNYPNPFNPETTISYDVAQSGSVTVDIYNLKGQKVKSLLNEKQEAGKHSVIWQGDNDDGKQVGSGTYFYRVKSGEQEVVKKMMLLK